MKGWLAQDSSVRRYPITIYKYKRSFFRRVLTQDLLTRMLTGEVNKYLQPQAGWMFTTSAVQHVLQQGAQKCDLL